MFSLPYLAQTFQSGTREIGYQIGTGYYLGDLNPTNPLKARNHIAQGGYYRHNINSRVGIRIQLMQAEIEAWDEDSKNAWAQNRNLHFRNKIMEFSVSGEINYIDFTMGDPGDRLTGYLTAGIAYFTHDPEAMDKYGNWHPLQPLGTEGQGWTFGLDPYKLNGIALPFGMGFKLNIGPAIAFQMEWGLRKTWTDYLDDVSTQYTNAVALRQARGELALELADRIITLPDGLSSSQGLQRGDPGLNDKYGFFLASLAFRVSKKPTSCWMQ
ncbi:MAG: hypothetical protein COA49_08815 [Bacteroidetes bacterium]|nr:MAG: hypothetical protein COA49_08815 [Bacteroidota bacterium]